MLTVLRDQMIWKVQTYHQYTVDKIRVYIPKGNYLTNLVYGEPKMQWLMKALMETQ